jgi:RNA polymerase sigma-70 factor (ECF subfamily)
MTGDCCRTDELLDRAGAGDRQALADLFALHRERLWRMIHLRLDRRLQGRLDPDDVLQETWLVYTQRFAEYAAARPLPFFLWLRGLAGQKLVDLHRQHLGARMRDAGREVSLYRGALPQASSVSLANQLLGRLTSASQAAARAELQLKVQEALNSMDPMDREVLTLRNFEMLSNEETSQILAITPAAASSRHIRALRRLKELLSLFPGLHG